MTERTGSDLPDQPPVGDATPNDREPDETAPTTGTPKASRSKAAASDPTSVTAPTAAADAPGAVAPSEPRPSVINIEQGGLDVARADRVSVNRGGITTVDATT